jgi:replicative DNA helicase
MRGSGQIEEACDIAVLIYRPNPKTEKANIYIAKGRNIGLGKETIKFNSSLSYFSDFEDGDPDAPYSEKKEELPF